MPDIKAELLDGVVYIISSAVSGYQSSPHADIVTWLGVYRAYTSGIIAGDNTTLHLPISSDLQPDAYLRMAPTHGGRTQLNKLGYVVGSPALMDKVANSCAVCDRKTKLPIYEREGVSEFILWRFENSRIDWHVLREGKFELLAAIKTMHGSMGADRRLALGNGLIASLRNLQRPLFDGEGRDKLAPNLGGLAPSNSPENRSSFFSAIDLAGIGGRSRGVDEAEGG